MTGREAILRFGEGSPVTIAVLPALFEEANRMRRFTISVMRLLAERGIGTALPDFPGTGESLTSLASVSCSDWHDFAQDLARQYPASIAFRGGSLFDSPFKHRWRLAPDSGARLLRDMVRATAMSSGTNAADIDAAARTTGVRLAGTQMSADFYATLQELEPAPDAVISAVEGPKLWRFAEPGDDPAFANAIANDITSWAKTCGVI